MDCFKNVVVVVIFFFLIDGTVFLIDLYTSRSILMKTRTKERRIRTEEGLAWN